VSERAYVWVWVCLGLGLGLNFNSSLKILFATSVMYNIRIEKSLQSKAITLFSVGFNSVVCRSFCSLVAFSIRSLRARFRLPW
jgi:hypothetical protein